jgi:hypothetical protein
LWGAICDFSYKYDNSIPDFVQQQKTKKINLEGQSSNWVSILLSLISSWLFVSSIFMYPEKKNKIIALISEKGNFVQKIK